MSNVIAVLYVSRSKQYRYTKFYNNDKEMYDDVKKHYNAITHAPSRVDIIPLYYMCVDRYYDNNTHDLLDKIFNFIGIENILIYMAYPLYVSKKGEK